MSEASINKMCIRDSVIPVDKMTVYPKMEREAYLEAFRSRDAAFSFDELQQRIVNLPYDGNNYDSDEVVKLNKVCLLYTSQSLSEAAAYSRTGIKYHRKLSA